MTDRNLEGRASARGSTRPCGADIRPVRDFKESGKRPGSVIGVARKSMEDGFGPGRAGRRRRIQLIYTVP
jgi:hypothetical protein